MARVRLLSIATSLALAMPAWVGDARAEMPVRHDDTRRAEGLVVEAAFIYGALRADEAKLHTLQTAPDLLQGNDLRLDGGSSFSGGAISAHVLTKGFRIGVVESFSGASGLRMLRAPLPDGYGLSTTAWRVAFEVDFGHQFVVGKLMPYADVRLGVSMLNATVGLVGPGVGRLGNTNYTAWGPVIGPRVGLLFPLSKEAVGDLAVTYGLLGHDAVGLSLGIGYASFGGLHLL